ncbi:MAG: hypothetical protein AAFY71_05015 [Bacteroidota bacterium]
MLELDSSYKYSNFFSLLGRNVGYLILIMILSYAGATAAGVVIMLGLFCYLSLYKPKLFLEVTVAFLVYSMMFQLQQTYADWGTFGGYARGTQGLSFLRRVTPSSPGMSNFFRVAFLAILIKIFPSWWRKYNKWEFNPFQVLFLLFLICCFVSMIVNGAFNKSAWKFVMILSLPFMYHLYMKEVNYTPKESSNTFSLFMFMSVEMQVIVSLLQNYRELPGKIFFDDYATGTFVFPQYELSGYFLTMGLFWALYKLLVNRKPIYILRAIIALYGIISISIVLFTVVLVLVLGASLIYANVLGILKTKELVLAFFVIMILGYPVYIIFTDESQGSNSSVHSKKMSEKYESASLTDIPKIYSYVNLYNMMTTEGRVIFGSGPGTFQTKFASGPIQRKYHTFNVMQTSQLSSSEFLENSTVGIIGEIGLQGYIVFILLYWYMVKRSFRYINLKKKLTGKPDAFATAILMTGILFFLFAFIRNFYEQFRFTIFFVILMEVGFKHIDTELKFIMAQRFRPDAPSPPPTNEQEKIPVMV